MWIFVLIGLVAAIFFIIKDLIKKLRSGGSTCSCGCSNCAMHDKCHSKKN